MRTPKVGVEIKELQGMGTKLFSGIKTASWTTFLGSLDICDIYLGPYMLIVWIYSFN